VQLGLVALLAGAVVLLASAAPASAGRILITGHDADLHCSAEGQGCNFVKVAVDYVRDGAQRPVLVLDRGALQLVTALDLAFEPNLARTVMDPRSPGFASEPLTTDRYSAILVASDESCGGCDLNEPGSAPDSSAINARAGDIAAFFNDGGGIYANAGGARADGDPGPADVYYDFLPLPAGGQPVTGPFCLTPIGVQIGLEDQLCPDASRHSGDTNDINCCATHNSFEPPDDSALRIAEIDVAQDGEISFDDVPETLVAEGVASGGEIVPEDAPPPVLGENLVAGAAQGDVLIKYPPGAGPSGAGARASQKGTDFVPLTAERSIPVRSILDTRKGTVALHLARNRKGKTQSGRFAAGVFQVLQSRKKREKGLTTLELKGSAARFKRCGGKGSSASGDAPARSSLTRRQIRRLRARASGRYRTRGRHSAATVRGTTWTVTDSCAGTLTTVKRGKVAVRDFRRKKTIVLTRGKRYLARARP
jgi:hypothetical protein